MPATCPGTDCVDVGISTSSGTHRALNLRPDGQVLITQRPRHSFESACPSLGASRSSIPSTAARTASRPSEQRFVVCANKQRVLSRLSIGCLRGISPLARRGRESAAGLSRSPAGAMRRRTKPASCSGTFLRRRSLRSGLHRGVGARHDLADAIDAAHHVGLPG
jgi:hypothetical protein